jgi:D-alanine transaminase
MSSSDVLVYLNGDFVPWSEATVSVEERAMQFGDAVYEVIRYYDGKPFRLDRHFARLAKSAEAILLPPPPTAEIEGAINELVARQNLGDASVYVQVTRGAGPRAHNLPADPKPFVIAIARPVPTARPRKPITAITASDDRWSKCYLKTTMLLPNTIARELARRRGAQDAIFVRDGFVMEGTAANFFIVVDGELYTAPLSNYILAGITREVVIELAAQEGIPCHESPIPLWKLDQASETFLSGTLSEVTAITEIDGRRVGDGLPGPVFERIAAAFDRMLGIG